MALMGHHTPGMCFSVVLAYATMSKGIMGIAGSKLVDEARDVSASMKEAAQTRVLMLSTSFSLKVGVYLN